MEIKTMNQLAKKYNLGTHITDSEGRFYEGNNCRGYIEKKEIAKNLKAILKKEFGIVVSSRTRPSGYLDCIIIEFKDSVDEMMLTYEEAIGDVKLRDEIQSYIARQTGISPKLDGNKDIKKFYNRCLRYGRSLFLNARYRMAYDFSKAYLNSFHSDHTGALNADLDYCDCNFFYHVNIECKDYDVDCSNDAWDEMINYCNNLKSLNLQFA